MPRLTLAYYCSGHGYGHATRVVFSESIAEGAHYRHADIDPVVVQPLAYHVDRQASVDVLRHFVSQKDHILEKERRWLSSCGVDAVLSDAAFLGCLAAAEVNIPAVLITNFTFDSVYSYLSTPLLDSTTSVHQVQAHLETMLPDAPVPYGELQPLVSEIWNGYRCADLLVRLPGFIPIPSFISEPALPAFDWVNVETGRLHPESVGQLHSPLDTAKFITGHGDVTRSVHPRKREVIECPLVVRPPSTNPSPYTPEGRAHILSLMGVPPEKYDPEQTKVLVVSFGGQTFRAPTRTPSRAPSPAPRDTTVSFATTNGFRKDDDEAVIAPNPAKYFDSTLTASGGAHTSQPAFPSHTSSRSFLTPLHARSISYPAQPSPLQVSPALPSPSDFLQHRHVRNFSTPLHLHVPGAPPALKTPATTSPSRPTNSSSDPGVLGTSVIVRSPSEGDSKSDLLNGDIASSPAETPEVHSVSLIPEGWIAVICGVSKEQWDSGQNHDLPDGFYIAPRDVYMPDLTAVADVLLGKLGYGTTSECVDACTAFVYVSRPLFVEEHGLRLLLDKEGVGVELSRRSYEMGEWASAVEEAWVLNRERKARKRAQAVVDFGVANQVAIRETARQVLEWIARHKSTNSRDGH